MNKHKNMTLKGIWFKRGELNNLINAIENNNKDDVIDILFGIHNRGDLK